MKALVYTGTEEIKYKSMSIPDPLEGESKIKIEAPFISYTKGEIIKIGLDLNLDYSKAWTCYEGKQNPCGKCGSCVERAEAFSDNNAMDPLI